MGGNGCSCAQLPASSGPDVRVPEEFTQGTSVDYRVWEAVAAVQGTPTISPQFQVPDGDGSMLLQCLAIAATAGVNVTIYLLGYDDQQNAILLGSGNLSALGVTIIGPTDINVRTIALRADSGAGTVLLSVTASIVPK